MCGEAVQCVARQFSVWRGSSVCGEALVSDFVDLSRHCEIVLSQRNFNLEQSQLRRIERHSVEPGIFCRQPMAGCMTCT